MTEKTMNDHQEAIRSAIKEAIAHADMRGEYFYVSVDDRTFRYMPNKQVAAQYYGYSSVEEAKNSGYLPEKAFWYGSNQGFWLSSSDEC